MRPSTLLRRRLDRLAAQRAEIRELIDAHAGRRRASAVPRRGGVPARAAGRRRRVRRASFTGRITDPDDRVGPALGRDSTTEGDRHDPSQHRPRRRRRHRRRRRRRWRSRRPASSRWSSRRRDAPPPARARSSRSARTGSRRSRQLGADAPALAAGFPTPAITLRSGTGKRLGDVPASTARPGAATSRTLMRAELAALLRAEADAARHRGRERAAARRRRVARRAGARTVRRRRRGSRPTC